MNRAEFQQLAECRLEEAIALLAAGKYSGAYYLGGYAIECALKSCVAKLTKEFEFPDKKRAEKAWTHSIEILVVAAGLKDDRETACRTDPDLASNWLKVKDWSEASRYELKDQLKAQDFLDAITDRNHGVLVWIKQYW